MRRTIALLLATTLPLLPLPAQTSPTPDRERAAHVLNRLAFGPRPGDVERVMQLGIDRWIEQQLHPERIADRAVEARIASLETLSMSNAEMTATFVRPLQEARRKSKGDDVQLDPATQRELRRKGRQVIEELSAQRILRAAESERQLNEVLVDFWMNHFNVFAGKGIDRFLISGYERDTIRPHIWGSFEELLMATAKAPAMLFYLDNARSVAAPENRRQMPNAVSRRVPQEMQRMGGLNENYARELMELHTLGVDGGYTQKDVTELARVFTGWTIAREEAGGFKFRPFLHDIKPKTVLGTTFAANGGIEEGERMIRLLAAHPSTARHVATKLCQRLVADEPPAALVERVAKRFLDTRGNLRETVRAVVTSPEFQDPRYFRAKVKSPFEYTISAVRALGSRIDDPLPLARELQKIGQPLYFAQPPTGYSDAAEAWVNSGALMSRINFALALAANKMPGVRIDESKLSTVDAGTELSAETRKTIKERGTDSKTVAALILGSPEFQRQ